MSPWSGKSDRKSKYVDKQDEILRETLVFRGIFSVMGAVGIRIPYRFYPAYSCFEEPPSARSGKQPKGSKRQAQDDGILEV